MLRAATTTSTLRPRREVIGTPQWGGAAPVSSCLLGICPGDHCLGKPQLTAVLQAPGARHQVERGTRVESSVAPPLAVWLVQDNSAAPTLVREQTDELSPFSAQRSWDLGTRVPWQQAYSANPAWSPVITIGCLLQSHGNPAVWQQGHRQTSDMGSPGMVPMAAGCLPWTSAYPYLLDNLFFVPKIVLFCNVPFE